MADLYTWMGKSERLADLTVSSEGATRARAIVALDALAGRELVINETGIKAAINSEQRNKIVSNRALGKSLRNGYSSRQLFSVAAVMDKAWEKASLAEILGDRARDKNILSIRRFETPMLLDGEGAIAYITAKESAEHGNRI